MKGDFTEFADVLVEITGGQKPMTTLKEVAFVLGVDYQTAWGYRQGNSEPRWRDVVRLSHHLIKEYGYYKLGMQPTMICISGASNGRVDDDLLAIHQACTDLHRAYPKDTPAVWNAIGEIEKQVKDLRAEAKEL